MKVTLATTQVRDALREGTNSLDVLEKSEVYWIQPSEDVPSIFSGDMLTQHLPEDVTIVAFPKVTSGDKSDKIKAALAEPEKGKTQPILMVEVYERGKGFNRSAYPAKTGVLCITGQSNPTDITEALKQSMAPKKTSSSAQATIDALRKIIEEAGLEMPTL